MDEVANQQAEGIKAVICNAIVMLAQAGEIEAATSRILFVRNKSTIGQLADKAGMAVFELAADNPKLAAQFPPHMYFGLPKQHVSAILTEVKNTRAEVVAQIKAMQEQLPVAEPEIAAQYQGEVCYNCEETSVFDGQCISCGRVQPEFPEAPDVLDMDA